MSFVRRYFSYFWQWNLLLISTLSIWVLIYALNHNDPVSGAEFWKFAALGSLIAAAGLGWVLPKYAVYINHRIPQRFANLTRLIAVVIVGVCLASYFIFIYSSFGIYIVSLAYRLLFIILLASLSTLALKLAFPTLNSKFSFIGFLLLVGVINRIFVLIPAIQSVPFSLGWSEGSDLYNASLFFFCKSVRTAVALTIIKSVPLLAAINFIFIYPGLNHFPSLLAGIAMGGNLFHYQFRLCETVSP